ncbi:MAG: hypothetical protein AAGG55_03670 [Pseudomonadota bacterium]
MPRTRGAANQSLYRARIALEAWDQARDASRHADAQLTATFLPAVQLHLKQAYGWFILAVSGRETADWSELPGSTDQLAAPDAGKSVPPELREFALLESEGWLKDMLAPWKEPDARSPMSAPEQLLTSDRSLPGFALAKQWVQRLNTLMDRMDDSLAEC